MRLRIGLKFAFVGLLTGSGCAINSSGAPPLIAKSQSAPVCQIAPSDVPVQRAVPVAQFHGEPSEIGAQHGSQFASEIHFLFDRYLLSQLPGRELLAARLVSAEYQMEMLPRHRLELQALGQAAKLNPYDAAWGQCFLDVTVVSACSTIALPASASPDGIARFGRDLDFPSLGVADKHTVLFIYHPRGFYQFAAIGWPGMIGVLSGMNEYGLCLANMEVPRPSRPPAAMPYTLLYRTILEQCRTVDQAIVLLRRTPRQSANNLMLMDAAGNRAVAEITPQGVVVRQGLPQTPLISTNHQRGQDQDTPGYCPRYDALHAAASAQFGRIDTRAMERMLGAVGSDMTLQSMIFEPANRVLYLAAGADAPTHPYQRIDLNLYFGSRPFNSTPVQ